MPNCVVNACGKIFLHIIFFSPFSTFDEIKWNIKKKNASTSSLGLDIYQTKLKLTTKHNSFVNIISAKWYKHFQIIYVNTVASVCWCSCAWNRSVHIGEKYMKAEKQYKIISDRLIGAGKRHIEPRLHCSPVSVRVCVFVCRTHCVALADVVPIQ